MTPRFGRRGKLAIVLPLALFAGAWWYASEPEHGRGRTILIAALVVIAVVGANVVHYLRSDD
jgi:hypothetical protein